MSRKNGSVMPKDSKPASKTVKPKIAKPAAKIRKKRKIVITKPVRIRNVIEMDDVLRQISHVQLQRTSVVFSIDSGESFVVDNLLRDAGLQFTKTELKDKFVYDVAPGPEKQEGVHALQHLEELD